MKLVPVVVLVQEDHVMLLDEWDDYCRARNPGHAAMLDETAANTPGWTSTMLSAGAFLGHNLAAALADGPWDEHDEADE